MKPQPPALARKPTSPARAPSAGSRRPSGVQEEREVEGFEAPEGDADSWGARLDAPRSFAAIGREAAKNAQRLALLDALGRLDWNLAAVARELSMSDRSTVRRAISDLGLEVHYKRAKIAGLMRPGRPSPEDQ